VEQKSKDESVALGLWNHHEWGAYSRPYMVLCSLQTKLRLDASKPSGW